MKKILGTVILLALGCFLLLGGFGQTRSEEVTCGGDVMVPGDICQEISGGSTTEYTYDEQKASNRESGWVLVAMGGVVLALGLAVGVSALVRRNRPVPAPAPGPGPVPGPYPPAYPGPAPYPGPQPYPQPQRGPYPAQRTGAAPPQYPPHR
jgi:hypothetical protein